MTAGPKTADAVVIGGGIMGASAAHFLAKRGFGRVVLLEKGRLAGVSTGHSAAIVRTYYSNPVTLELAKRALHMFENDRDLLGGDCGFRPIGFLLLIGERLRAAGEHILESERRHGLHVERLSVEEVADLAPPLSLDGVSYGILEPRSGYADPTRTTENLVAAARPWGLEPRAWGRRHERPPAWRPGGRGGGRRRDDRNERCRERGGSLGGAGRLLARPEVLAALEPRERSVRGEASQVRRPPRRLRSGSARLPAALRRRPDHRRAGGAQGHRAGGSGRLRSGPRSGNARAYRAPALPADPGAVHAPATWAATPRSTRSRTTGTRSSARSPVSRATTPSSAAAATGSSSAPRSARPSPTSSAARRRTSTSHPSARAASSTVSRSRPHGARATAADFSLELPAHPLYPPPVYSEIEETDARRRRYMCDVLRRAPSELQIVAEPEPGSADRMQVIVRRRDDAGTRHGGDDCPEATKEVDRVSRRGERCHPVNPPRAGFAAHVVVPEPPEPACRNLVAYQCGVKRCIRRPVEASPT